MMLWKKIYAKKEAKINFWWRKDGKDIKESRMSPKNQGGDIIISPVCY